jgi:hypothetical protein
MSPNNIFVTQNHWKISNSPGAMNKFDETKALLKSQRYFGDIGADGEHQAFRG